MKLKTSFPEPDYLAPDPDEISYPDEIWVQVVDEDENPVIEIPSKEILRGTLYSEDQYEGGEARLYPEHLAVFTVAGGGQGGGTMIWRLEDQSKIYSEREFPVHAFINLASHHAFILFHSIGVWSHKSDMLKVVKYDGSSVELNLDPDSLTWLHHALGPSECERSSPQIVFQRDKGRLVFCGNKTTICSVEELFHFVEEAI